MTDSTSGSDTRHARSLNDVLMAFELDAEVAAMRAEPGYTSYGRTSKTLGKGEHVRLVLTVAKAGARVGDQDAEAPVAVQVLDGEVTIDRDGTERAFGAGSLVWLGEGDWWNITVERDAALVLSIGWPGVGGDEAATDARREAGQHR